MVKVKEKIVVERNELNTPIAVLSGDIIRSTDLSDEMYEDLLYTLHNQLALIRTSDPNNKFEISRGDAFQIFVKDAKNAATYALLIRTSLRSRNSRYDCRISVAIGNNEGMVFRNSLGSSTGNIFTLSGRNLDSMKPATLKITTPIKSFNENFELLTKYLDNQMSGLTERQSEIVYEILKNITLNNKNITQKEIAETLEVNRVSVNRSINSANLNLITEYVEFFSKKITEYFI
ncbi:MarR family transcriptional regulator [Shewanella mangrovi]|nr:MarR family transcriptional regulator [Shewanella mangrovi]